MQNYLCADCEGVFTPEVWIQVAKKTQIEELKITTKEEPDYDKLMKNRIRILRENNIKLKEITEVISKMKPLEGARDFLDWTGDNGYQVGILSDTFTQFAKPLMKQLGYPSLFCNELIIDDEGFISDYKLRQMDQKREVVKAMKNLKYNVIAFGDSYNDITMLEEADGGILYSPPQNIINEFPQFSVAKKFDELKEKILKLSK
jgi:phosphoserine / homoserine phosphotransferase